jgi:hypothetical protein
MRTTLRLLPLLMAAIILTGCKESKKENEVTYFPFQAEEGGGWGMMDTEGNVLFSDEFENSPGPAINDRFYIYDDESWCIYAAEPRPRKIGEYKDVGCFSMGLCPVVNDDNDMMYIDLEGNTVIDIAEVNGKKVTAAYAFYCSRALIKLENEKYGYIDMEGHVVIPCRYENAWSFNEGAAVVYIDEQGDDDDAKWGVIDTEGNVLFTKKYSEMTPSTYKMAEGFILCSTSDGKVAIVDKTGAVVRKVRASSANDIYNGHFVFYDGNNEKYGLMTTDGQVAIRARYSSLQYNGAFLVGQTDSEERYYLLSITGEKICKLPKGYPTLFEPCYKGYDKCFFMGEYSEQQKMIGPDGQRINLSTSVYGINNGFFTLAITQGDGEDFDYEDYEEEEEYYDYEYDE